jgi:chromatin remodeling complex protein RSC6
MSSSDSKTKKTATKKVVAESAPAPVVAAPAPVPAAAAPAEKKVRAKKAPAATPAKVEAVVPTVASPDVSAPAAESTASADQRLTAVAERLRGIQSSLATELKEIAKDLLAAVKVAQREIKDSKKRKRSKRPEEMTPEEKKAWEARRANNAFLKPRGLSGELCAFMRIAAGSQRSQTEVTKFVSTYVKEHNCFDPANKRRILPDGALAKLLKVTDKDTVTYLNLQSYLKAHFIKTA